MLYRSPPRGPITVCWFVSHPCWPLCACQSERLLTSLCACILIDKPKAMPALISQRWKNWKTLIHQIPFREPIQRELIIAVGSEECYCIITLQDLNKTEQMNWTIALLALVDLTYCIQYVLVEAFSSNPLHTLDTVNFIVVGLSIKSWQEHRVNKHAVIFKHYVFPNHYHKLPLHSFWFSCSVLQTSHVFIFSHSLKKTPDHTSDQLSSRSACRGVFLRGLT